MERLDGSLSQMSLTKTKQNKKNRLLLFCLGGLGTEVPCRATGGFPTKIKSNILPFQNSAKPPWYSKSVREGCEKVTS